MTEKFISWNKYCIIIDLKYVTESVLKDMSHPI